MLTLPCFPELTDDEVERVCEVLVAEALRRARRAAPVYSVVVPVYRNEPTLGALVERLGALAGELDAPLEVVFVVDGSPDGSLVVLRRLLAEETRFSSQLISLSRNFGSFSAVRAGLAAAEGELPRHDGGRPPGAGLARPRLLRRPRVG